MKNGELVIKPTLLSDNFVKRGILKLKGYAKDIFVFEIYCTSQKQSFIVILFCCIGVQNLKDPLIVL